MKLFVLCISYQLLHIFAKIFDVRGRGGEGSYCRGVSKFVAYVSQMCKRFKYALDEFNGTD
jgi:hypothetical protein